MSDRHPEADAILIGAGIMGATLGSLLKELEPDWNITVFEKLSEAGQESSNERHNSGTGHAALCEMNYTVEQPDGSIDIGNAVKINERFQLSRQFWSYLVQHKRISNPRDFIAPVPHISFVQGKNKVAFLKKRFRIMADHPYFQDMVYSDNPGELTDWIPLMMKGRAPNEPVAATRTDAGTDVNYGQLSRLLVHHLKQSHVHVKFNHEVKDIRRASDGSWELTVRNANNGAVEHHAAKFVFIGGGGGSLPLLQKTRIHEGRQYGGFPISGLYLACNNPDVIRQHNAKVCGSSPAGAPLIVVPHLDTRFLDRQRSLIFGPFAGFSPKFLKNGSNRDLLTSINRDNLLNMLAAGIKNRYLLKYLIQQLRLSKEQRMAELRMFVPGAKDEDWELKTAGQRVQMIKPTAAFGRGTIQFSHTEVVTSADGSLAVLLGGSPGASTSVSDMLAVLKQCFPRQFKEWRPKLREMMPSCGENLLNNPELLADIHSATTQTLQLDKKIPLAE